jgi:hypothetical protein
LTAPDCLDRPGLGLKAEKLEKQKKGKQEEVALQSSLKIFSGIFREAA